MKRLSSAEPALGALSRPVEPGEAEWKRKRFGRCEICQTYGRIILHHVVGEQEVRRATTPEQRAAGICWDQRNAMRVGAPVPWGGRCRCHPEHHLPGVRDTRISFRKVRAETLEFAEEVLGWGPATEFFRRRYRDAP